MHETDEVAVKDVAFKWFLQVGDHGTHARVSCASKIPSQMF